MAIVGLLAGVRLLTELLDPVAYGELALGLTVATLINQVLFGPLGHGVTRFYAPAAEQNDLGGYVMAVKSLMLRTTVIILLLAVVCVCGLLMLKHAEWALLVVGAVLFAAFGGINSVLSGIQSAARQRPVVAMHQGAEPWLRFLLASGLVVWLGGHSTVAMIGFAVAALLILASQYRYLRKLIPNKSGGDADGQTWLNRIWEFSWPISFFGIFTWMQLVSDRWSLGQFSSTQEVGLYAVLFQIGFYPMSIASGMVMQFIVPIVYQRAGDATDILRTANVSKLNWNMAWMTLGITAAVFVVAYLFHSWIFGIFVAKQYMSVSYLLPWMLLCGGVQAAAQTVALNMMSQMKTRKMMTAKTVTALIGVVLNCAGAYWYGILGVVIAGNLFAALLFVWISVLSLNSKRNLWS